MLGGVVGGGGMLSLLLFPQPPPLTAGPPHQVPRASKAARKFFLFGPYTQASSVRMETTRIKSRFILKQDTCAAVGLWEES